MTWITECVAPDLTALQIPVLANYFLNAEFTNQGGHDNPVVRAYIHGLIRTTDKSLRSYNTGRQLLIDYSTSTNRTMLLIEGLDQFETCISSVKRSLAFADRMARHKENPEISRTSKRLLENLHGQLRPLRDAIEHMDEDIAKGVVQQGDVQTLIVSRDGRSLQISAHTLAFSDLASALHQLHAIALAVAQRDRHGGAPG